VGSQLIEALTAAAKGLSLANANTPGDTAHEHLEQFCAKAQASLAAALGADRAALIVGRFAAAVIGRKRD
jgi:hypothetical protein